MTESCIFYISGEVEEKGNDSDGTEEEAEDGLPPRPGAGDCLSVGGCRDGGWSGFPCTERLSFICQKKVRP